MPDLQTENRNEKLQDIREQRHFLRHDIWSGMISSFLGGANDICALLGFIDVSRQPIRPETSAQNNQSAVHTTPEDSRPRNVLTVYST